jgi:hypothetical protein
LATAYGGEGLTKLATQPVCHNAFDGEVWLGKLHAKISGVSIILRILAGIDKRSYGAGAPFPVA